MIKSPGDLLEIATKFQVSRSHQEEQNRIDSEEQAELLFRIKKSAMTAALGRKDFLVCTSRFKWVEALKILGFKVQSIKRDDAREVFLTDHLSDVEKNIYSVLAELVRLVPGLDSARFKNLGSVDIFSFFVASAYRGCTSEDAELLSERILQVSWLKKNELGCHQGLISTALSDAARFVEAESSLARVRSINRSIPENESEAWKISWYDALPCYTKAGVIDAQKLKWVVSVWPRWEAYFEKDFEKEATSGKDGKEYLFFSAEYWSYNDSFVVSVGPLLDEHDKDLCTHDEIEIQEYWAEIDERGDTLKYDREEELLLNVEPLPVAELLLAQGFQVKILLSHSESDEDQDTESEKDVPSDEEIQLADLDFDRRDSNQDYVLCVSWAGRSNS
jgi:hypothetical protein